MAHAVDDLEQLIHRDVLAKLGPDPSGELSVMPLASLLIIYFNWRARFIPVRPRLAHLSAELLASPKCLEHQGAVDFIVAKIESGDDLTPHLSRWVTEAYEPTTSRSAKNQRRSDLDLLMAEWGIHHLHLSTDMEADGFVRRTKDLLFASFQSDDAYLIGIFEHGNWTRIELATITVRNWSDAGIFRESRSALRLAQPTVEADRPLVRNAGVTLALEIDGKVYMPPGQSVAGTPLRATKASNHVMHTLRSLREMLSSRPEELSDAVREAGFDLSAATRWEAFFHEGWYGIREENTGAFFRSVVILE